MAFASAPPIPSPRDSLARARPGQVVEIRRIHFGLVRDRCAELGIREGDVVRCLRRSGGEVVLAFPEGHTAGLELHYAHFVELGQPASQSVAPPAA